ncbi:oligosaccharide flippase family protein [Novosphingobium mangrovi (ex Huang et al. 2023)]|uniref:Oligosaccharide flippase family protein n=1 Tax=Novosphingobium mangrovi (ex Huang et al. 2023) TaxID=2976432 RepID=A0ABT2I0T2_9SPHN|nr:oligosaccharide flippase family protein [Novosphingobium mangrovi (ex Huang et al. 2023)]MCT2398414.1 oligosaccharide flippase family protein [Novosphingobium mangrovi (ex Huang et al. 2023)]
MIAKIKYHFQSLAALTIRGSAVLAGFFVTFFIGRTMGPEANGTYALVTQTAMFLSVVAVGGVDMAAVRELSRAIAMKTSIDRRTYVSLIGWSMLIALIISAVIVFGGHRVTGLLLKEMMPINIIIILVVIFIARTLTRLMSAILRSQKSFIFGQSIEGLFIPTMVSMVLLTGMLHTVEEVLLVTAIAGIATGIFAVLMGLKHTVTAGSGLHISFSEILKVAIPLWSVGIALNIGDWYGLVTVASVLGVYDAGLYRVAFQIASVLSIITIGLYSVFSTQIGAARAAGNLERIAKLGRSATRLSIAFAAPVVLIILIFASQLLGIVGEEFIAAAEILRVMAFAQAIYVMTGPCGLTLAMCGHEKVNMIIALTALALLVFTAPIAARWGGLTGVTACIGLIMAGRNIASFFAVLRLTGINVVTGTVR